MGKNIVANTPAPSSVTGEVATNQIFPEGLQFLGEYSREKILQRVDDVQALDKDNLLPTKFFSAIRDTFELVRSARGAIACQPVCQDLILKSLQGSFESLRQLFAEQGAGSELKLLTEFIEDAELFISSRCASVVVHWAPDLLSRIVDEAEIAIQTKACVGDHCPTFLRGIRDLRESELAKRIFAAQNREGALDLVLHRMDGLIENPNCAGLHLLIDSIHRCRDVFSGPKNGTLGLMVDTPDARFSAAFKYLLTILPDEYRDEFNTAEEMCFKRLEMAQKILTLIKAEHDWELWNTPDCLHYSAAQIRSFIDSPEKGFDISDEAFADPMIAIRDDDISFPWVERLREELSKNDIASLVEGEDLGRCLARSYDQLTTRNSRYMPDGDPLRIFQYNPELYIHPPNAVIEEVCALQHDWSPRRRDDPKTPVIEFPFSTDDLLKRLRQNREVYIIAKKGDDILGAYLLFVNGERLPWSGNEITRVLDVDAPTVAYADEVLRNRKHRYPGLYHLLDLSMESAARIHTNHLPSEIVGIVEPSNRAIMSAHAPLGWRATNHRISSPDGRQFDVIRRSLARVD